VSLQQSDVTEEGYFEYKSEINENDFVENFLHFHFELAALFLCNVVLVETFNFH